eukprot:TRINITY_DN9119_c0_g1_i1.p1 TRINITY_DN9119_c0_g1~~TRINITY_DN9119_c0_g1_i1.p1  ORF type:complete len:255 (-),score=35.96 TRINITY_DN9119_c0_g1_i1:53-817(-)
MLRTYRRIFPQLWVEFLGTYFLVLTVAMNVMGRTENGGIAIGSTLMIIVFSGGYISGGHFNPAVTLAVYLRGKIGSTESVFYLISQLLGSFIAAWCAFFVFDKTFAVAPQHYLVNLHWKNSSALFVEFIWTFLLCSVILHTATTKAQEGNSFFGLAIGFTVLAGAISMGPISGGAFNPAVATGPAIVQAIIGKDHNGRGRKDAASIWIYWLGPLMGGICSAFAFRIATRDRDEERQPLVGQSNRVEPEDDDEYV